MNTARLSLPSLFFVTAMCVGIVMAQQPLTTATDADGDYRFTNVPAGKYRLQVHAPVYGEPGFAITPLASIKGKVVLEKMSPPTDKCDSQRESHLDEIVLLSRKDAPPAKTELDLTALGVNSPGVPNAQGAFTLRGLSAGRCRVAAQLPDANWYLKSVAMTPVNPAFANLARDGLAIKAGEKLSGLTVTVATGAANVKGTIKAANNAKLPARLRVHLLPAEADAKDNLLRFAEVVAESGGAFSFTQLAPGKYLLVARAVPENESPDKAPRTVAWDAAERAKLRKEAEAVNVLVELKPCQRVTDFVLTWK